jgi:hypothetical protein
MNRFNNGFSALADGLSTVSSDELDKVEGGQAATMSWIDPRTVGTIVESFVREATARYEHLKRTYG